MVFRQWWTDERLDYRNRMYNNKTEFEIPAYVTIYDGRDHLWLPDTYFYVRFYSIFSSALNFLAERPLQQSRRGGDVSCVPRRHNSLVAEAS